MMAQQETTEPVAVLFVCTGNICRSPLAEGVFRAFVLEAGLGDRIVVDSAGTASYHVGDAPDARTREVARRRGVVLESVARKVAADDLQRFDHVLVMDNENLAIMERLARKAPGRAMLQRLREFDPAADGELDVPDPYYGGLGGFEHVQDIVERSCRVLLEEIRRMHEL